ncbi:alcohol acetyltransferase [Dactylonectria macrodidyma]|uniref:Alcohol acetyltransferase n=1 Tax=Dactylonectria macrodidyma TaxID=307937 RepID=A0A9P9DYF4_9HYPO|nr:alcohol acetyltransferase [Dactylonectria macrodidyma]
MAESPTPLAIRPLGAVELYSSSRHPLGLYRCVVLTGRYTNPPPGTNADAAVFAALSRLVSAHPMLRVGIIGEDTDAAHFSHVAEVDLQKHVGFRTLPAGGHGYEAGLEAVHAWCHDQLWPDIETRPPWRVIVVRPEGGEPFEDIVFAFHHSLMDGTSAKNFHEQLVEALNEPSAEVEPPHILQFPNPPVLPEAQETVIPYTNGKLLIGRALWGEFAPAFLQPAKPPIWSGEPIDLKRPHQARVRAVDITPAVVSSMLTQSRSHSASIASLLHALCLVSMARRIPVQDGQAFTASTPVNARPYMAATANPALKDSFRVMISSVTHEYSAAEVDALRRPDADLDALIWHHAQVVKNEIRTRAATLPADDPTSLLKLISNWSSHWHKKNGQPRGGSWEISSLGAMRADTSTNRPSQRRISRVLFTNGIMVAGEPLSISVASSPGGELTAGISWNAGVVPDELMEGLAEDLLAYTTRLHKTGKFTA